MKVKVTPLCLTLCDPMDYTVHGSLQARILEWVAFPFSRGSSTLWVDSLPAEPPEKPNQKGRGWQRNVEKGRGRRDVNQIKM